MEINNLLSMYENEYVILVDLSWVLYRSYYAFKELSNEDGVSTGSFYGLTKTLITLSEEYPTSLILLVDDGNPVERKELNESYKGNREHTVHFQDKKHSVDCLIQYLDNVFRVYDPYKEADDLIFSISRIKDYKNHFIIYSSDKDLYQAIDSTTCISNSISRGSLVLFDNKSDQYINNFMDLEPYQLPFYRAVLGDPSDNLSIIRPRFPSKVAYYFAKNYIKSDGYEIHILKPPVKPDDLTDNQYKCLLEIYSNPNYVKNLKIMRLEPVDNIPIIEKVKTKEEVIDLISYLQLRVYLKWLNI